MRQQTPQLVQTHDRPPISRFSAKGLQEYVLQLRTHLTDEFHETVKTHFPDHRVTTDPQKILNQPGYCWFFEPLCGEENFLRSLPEYCAVIGIFDNGSLQYAIVYHYLEDVEFYATKEEGAIVNNNRLRVSGTDSLARAVVAYAQQDSVPSFIQYQDKLQPQVLSVRCSGCIALDLARVAQGKLDACVYAGTNQSIPLATSLLVTEAGGFTTRVTQNDEVFVAGSPKVYRALQSNLLGINQDSILSRKA